MERVILDLLSAEKQRFDNLIVYMREKLKEASKPALSQKAVKGVDGQDKKINYIDLSKFTEEQKQSFDAVCNKLEELEAKAAVFDSYIKSLTNKKIIEQYNKYVSDLSEFHGLTINADNIELDENMKFTRFSIKVCNMNVVCSRKMAFEEYSSLYTSSLSKLLYSTLSNNLNEGQALNEEQAMELISKACSQIYLNQTLDQDVLNEEAKVSL